MKLRQCFLTENDCFKRGAKIVPKGIVVHSTGANNPELRRYVQPDDGELGKNRFGNHWNMSFRPGVCVHAFVGKLSDGTVAAYQTLPWDMRCWGCGGGRNGSYNDSRIQFEICEDDLRNSEYFEKAYREVVELCTYLCEMYGLDPLNICDHSEAHKQGYGSAHADVSHWFPRFGKSMDTLRADVKEALEGMTYEQWKAYQTRYEEELSEKEPSEWSRADREFAEKIGLIQGDGNRKQYKAFCTREQMVVFLSRVIRFLQK